MTRNEEHSFPIDPTKITDLSILQRGVVSAILFAKLDKERQKEEIHAVHVHLDERPDGKARKKPHQHERG